MLKYSKKAMSYSSWTSIGAHETNDYRRITMTRNAIIVAVVGMAIVVGGCATVIRIDSDPQWATVLVSDDQQGPWSEWHPEEGQHLTPSTVKAKIPRGTVFWFRATKNRYKESEQQPLRVDKPGRYDLFFQLEKELVLYRGKWVDPEEEGLVPYEDEWMTPDERAAQMEAEKPVVEEIREADEGAPAGVLVEGIAAIRDGNVPQARRAAIDDALAAALEQKLGVSITSTRVAENYILRENRIRAEASGTIRTFDILEEEQLDGAYWVRLRAMFKDDLVRARHLDTVQVVIMGDESYQVGSVRVLKKVAATTCSKALTRAFLDSGFRVVSAVYGGDETDLNKREVLIIGRSSQADLVVQVTAHAREGDRAGNFITFTAEADATAFKSYAGETVAQHHVTVRGERKLSEQEAAHAALEQAGTEAAAGLIESITSRYEGMLAHELIVSNVRSRGQVDVIRHELLSKPDIKGVSVLEYADEVCAFELELSPEAKGKIDEYVNRLKDQRLKVTQSLPQATFATVEQR